MSRRSVTVALAVLCLALRGSMSLDFELPAQEEAAMFARTDVGVLPMAVASQSQPSAISLSALQRASSNAEAVAQAEQIHQALVADRTGTLHNLFVTWSRMHHKYYKSLDEANAALDAFTFSVDSVVRLNLKTTQGALFSFNHLSGVHRKRLQAKLATSSAGTGSPLQPSPLSPAPPAPPQNHSRTLNCTPSLKKAGLCFSGAKLTRTQGKGGAAYASTTNLPTAWDWVSRGKIPAVKYQGESCSSCWAISAMTTIEAAIGIVYHKGPPPLSRQIIVDCANSIDSGPGFENCYGCNQGDSSAAIMFAQWHTVPYDKYYPYVSGATGAANTCKTYYMGLRYSFNSYAQGNGVNYYQSGSQLNLKAAVRVQPVVIYWSLSTGFQYYQQDLYTINQQNDMTDGCYSDAGAVDHAMVLVGYSAIPGKPAYWIIQNSWGTAWGQAGYIWVEMTANKEGPCGMYSYVIGPVMAFQHVPKYYVSIDPKNLVWKSTGIPITAGNHSNPFDAAQCAQTAAMRAQPGGAGVNCNQISSVAITPDNSKVAAGLWDYTVRLFTVANQRPISPVFSGHADRVTAVAFSADGVYLASGSADGTVKVWDVIYMKPMFTLTGHTGAVLALAFSPDGTTLATGSDDTTVRLWDVTAINNTLTAVPPFITTLPRPGYRGHSNSVQAIAWAGDGRTIITGSADSTIRLWSRTTNPSYLQVGSTFTGSSVFAASIAPNGMVMASAGNDYTLRLWNMTVFGDNAPLIGWCHGGYTATDPSYAYRTGMGANRRITVNDTSHTDRVTSVAFSPDGQIVVSGGYDKMLRVFNTTTMKQIIAIPNIDVIKSVAFSRDGWTIISGGFSGQIQFYTLKAP